MKQETKRFDLFENINLTDEQRYELNISGMVGEIIIELISRRLELNMSQRDLAEKTGIKQPMIARIEKFDSIPRIDTLVKIAYALGMTMHFDRTDDHQDNIKLEIMTTEYANSLFTDFINDPCMVNSNSSSTVLCENAVEYNYVQKYKNIGYVLLAIILNDDVIGEVRFKNIKDKKAELGIILKNDNYKNKGYGTQAINQALLYAKDTLKLNTITVSILHKNQRSIHVFEKLGFVYEKSDNEFRYYYKNITDNLYITDSLRGVIKQDIT